MTDQRKRVLYTLFFAFVMSEAVFRLLVEIIRRAPEHIATATVLPPSVKPLVYGIAALALLASLRSTFVRTRFSTTWSQFQTNVILSLALSEFCTIIGLVYFFLGAPPSEFNRFIIASVAVDLFVILPQIARR